MHTARLQRGDTSTLLQVLSGYCPAASRRHGSLSPPHRSIPRPLSRRPERSKHGGANESRTRGLRIANAALSQLSYRPMYWSSVAESNRRPSAYETDALPTELTDDGRGSRTRTRTTFRPLAPEASASTNFATWALHTSTSLKLGGDGWIRTTVSFGAWFTARCNRPLCHIPMKKCLVPRGGLEPPRPFGHCDLNAARLPIPPPGQVVLHDCLAAF